jgi:hypothetical protein
MKHKYTHTERRLLYKQNFDNIRDKIVEPNENEENEGAAKETEQERERRLKSLGDLTNSTLETYQNELKDFPENLQTKFQDELNDYFETSLEAFDTNTVEGLSKEEYEAYKSHLRGKIDSNMIALKQAVGVMEDKAEKEEEEMEEAQQQAEQEQRTVEELQADLQNFETETLPALKLDSAELEQIQNPEVVEKQMQKYQDQFMKLQEAQSNLMQLSGAVFSYRDKAEESLKLLDAGVDAGGAAASVAAGAAIGTAIGGWAFGLGTVVGAVGGAIAYGVSKGVAAMAMAEERQKQADAANALIKSSTDKFKASRAEIQEASNEFSSEGDKFNAAPEAFRLRAEEVSLEHQEQYSQNTEQLAQAKAAKEQEIAQVRAAREQMQLQRDALQGRRDFIEQQRIEAEQQGVQVEMSKDDMQGNISKVDEAIASIRKQMGSADETQKAELQAKLDQLVASKEAAEKGVTSLEEGAGKVDEAKQALDQESVTTEDMGTLVNRQGLMLANATGTLDSTLAQLGEQEVALLAEKEQFDAQMELGVKGVDDIDSLIADNVFDAEVKNLGSMANLQKQEKLLTEIPSVEAPGFISSLSDGFTGFAKASEWLFVDTISGSLDTVSNWLQEATTDIPVLGQITYGVTEMTLGVTSGLTAGTGELLSGISTMLANPVQTAKGLGALVGLNPDVPAGKAWTEMGKALIAYKEFEDGNVGKGVGKVALNVLLTATGAGAAGNGAKATGMAFRAARAAGQGVVRASLKAGAVGVRVGVTRLASGAVRLPGNVLRGVGKTVGGVLKAPARLFSGVDDLARMEAAVASSADELAAAGKNANAILEGSKLPQQLANMSADELAALAKNGDELAKLGITGGRNIDDFLRYQQAVQKAEKAALALKAAEEARQAANVSSEAVAMSDDLAEQLPKIQDEVRTQLEPKIAKAKEELALAESKYPPSSDEIVEAQKNLKGLQKQMQTVDDVVAGKITLEQYEGLRDVKALKGNIRAQQYLAQKVLENSGKTIDDVINMEKTLGVARELPAQVRAELAAAKLEQFGVQGCSKIIEGIRSGRLDYKSLRSLDDAIRALPASAERTMLTQLSDDLAGMVDKGLITADEAGVILRDSAEFMDDYAKAIAEGGFEGSTVSNMDEVLGMMRNNQRKLAHQTVVDRAYLTGSDHGILHVIEGDMRMATELADDLIKNGRMSAREKVLLRQSIIDHDMGYTLNTLEQYGAKGKDLKGLTEGYYAMTKDHPLYSGILHETNKADYVRFFGEDGFNAMAVLDHSDPTGALRAIGESAKGTPRGDVVQWLITHADPMGVSADVKMMKIFQEPAMMEQLAKVMGPADEFGKFKSAKKLIASGKGTADEIAAARQFVDNFPLEENLRQLAGVRRNMKQMIRQKYAGTPDMDSFTSAIDRFCDPRQPHFAATRDFGSHSLNFRGVALEGDNLVATFQVNEAFAQVGKAFGNPKLQISAAAKVLDDFGYVVKDKGALAERLGALTDDSVTVQQLMDEGIVSLKTTPKGQPIPTDTAFIFEGPGTVAQTAENMALGNVLRRQNALRDALQQVENITVIDDFNNVVNTVAQKFDDTYTLTRVEPWRGSITQTASEVFKEIGQLSASGKLDDAKALLQQLRDQGRGTLRNAA